MELVAQVELEAQWHELQRHSESPEIDAYRLARFVEARLSVQENGEMNRLKARVASLESTLAKLMEGMTNG